MATTKFEPGKSYGNDLTIEIISRSNQFVTFKTVAWGIKRAKVVTERENEKIYFKAWIIYATDAFDFETARQNAYERAYY